MRAETHQLSELTEELFVLEKKYQTLKTIRQKQNISLRKENPPYLNNPNVPNETRTYKNGHVT